MIYRHTVHHKNARATGQSFIHLIELGIKDIAAIDRYSICTDYDEDVLKICFQKKKGELLARKAIFRFPRASRRVPSGGGKGELVTVSEISPQLRHIIDELDQLEDI